MKSIFFQDSGSEFNFNDLCEIFFSAHSGVIVIKPLNTTGFHI